MVARPSLDAALNRRWTLLLLLAGACGTQPHTTRALHAGDQAPRLLAASRPDAVRISWVFEGRDLVRCRSSARELRRLSARFGDAVELNALAIAADPAMVRSFLRAQRISPAVIYVRGSRNPEVRMLSWPGLYVVRGSRVERIYPGVPPDDDALMQSRDVEQFVAALLGRSALATFTLTNGGGT